MAHELADWLRNAAPETLESLGLHRKGEESAHWVTALAKLSIGVKVRLDPKGEIPLLMEVKP